MNRECYEDGILFVRKTLLRELGLCVLSVDPSTEEKTHVRDQIANIVKALQRAALPSTIRGFGGAGF